MTYGHRNCTAILPAVKRKEIDELFPAWMRERTHGCWCSAWKLDEDGQWWVWRDRQWCKPNKGEMTKWQRAEEGGE